METKLLNKNFIIITAASCILAMSVSMMNTALPLYAQSLNLSNTVVGLITAVYTLGIILSRPLFGSLIDRKGRKGVLLVGIIIFTVFILPFHFAKAAAFILLLRFLQGVGFSAYSTTTGTVVTDVSPANKLLEGIGYFSVFSTIFMMSLGPALCVTLKPAGFDVMFIVAAAIGAGGLLVSLLLDYEKKRRLERAEQPDQSAQPQGKGSIIETSILKLCLANVFIALTVGIISTFLPIYAFSKGIGDVSLYFIVNAAALLATRPFLTKLTRRIGTMAVIIIGIVLMGAALVILGFANNIWLFLLASVLNGIGFGINNPVVNSLSYKLCPVDRRGAATATLFGVFDGGIGIGAAIGGVVSQYLGFPVMFLGFSAFLAVSAALYVALVKPQMRQKGIEDKEA